MILLVFVTFVDLFVTVFSVLLVTRIIMSYLASPDNGFYQTLVSMTEPLLEPVRRGLPSMAGLDLSPLVTYLLLQGVQWLVHYLSHM